MLSRCGPVRRRWGAVRPGVGQCDAGVGQPECGPVWAALEPPPTPGASRQWPEGLWRCHQRGRRGPQDASRGGGPQRRPAGLAEAGRFGRSGAAAGPSKRSAPRTDTAQRLFRADSEGSGGPLRRRARGLASAWDHQGAPAPTRRRRGPQRGPRLLERGSPRCRVTAGQECEGCFPGLLERGADAPLCGVCAKASPRPCAMPRAPSPGSGARPQLLMDGPKKL